MFINAVMNGIGSKKKYKNPTDVSSILVEMVFYSALFIIHPLTVRIHFVDTYQIYIIHTHCRMKPITHYILFNLVA